MPPLKGSIVTLVCQQGKAAIRDSGESFIGAVSSWNQTKHDSIGANMRNLAKHFFEQGWCQFDFDPLLLEWVEAALTPARATIVDARHAEWHRCGGTWFAGVNVLPNGDDSSIGNYGPLKGNAVDFIGKVLGLRELVWDAAQISVCYPGYPQPMASETEASARYRRRRDAAHVDGLLPVGAERRRHLREFHGFILGMPMVDFDANASPFVVWEKSHEVVRQVFTKRFDGIPAEQWGEQDVTEVYHSARETIFETCKRVEVVARPGEAFIAHRLILHGIAPWRDKAQAGEDGRMICYFRPETSGPKGWLKNR